MYGAGDEDTDAAREHADEREPEHDEEEHEEAPPLPLRRLVARLHGVDDAHVRVHGVVVGHAERESDEQGADEERRAADDVGDAQEKLKPEHPQEERSAAEEVGEVWRLPARGGEVDAHEPYAEERADDDAEERGAAA